MTMPRDLVFVRHGLSEANIIQRAEKAFERGEGAMHPQTQEIYARPDYLQRLSEQGVEQARLAGEWLGRYFMAAEDFDGRYVSPFNRTMDTAHHLGGEATTWLPDLRLVERDWGLYGATPKHERSELFPHTEKGKDDSSFFVRYDNGESIADVVYRVRDFVDTLSRDMADRQVLAVTHGELMWAARAVMERMLPQEWQELDLDKRLRIGNCCIMWYSRQNPEDPTDIRSSLADGWLRMVDPVEPEKSPYGGEPQKLPGKRRFSGKHLDELTAQTPRLIEPLRNPSS